MEQNLTLYCSLPPGFALTIVISHISIFLSESKENKKTSKLAHAKWDGIHQAECCLSWRHKGRQEGNNNLWPCMLMRTPLLYLEA